MNETPADRLLLGIVHDVRSLVRRGLVSAQLLERSSRAALDEPAQDLLREVVSSGKDLDHLLGRIAEYANAPNLVNGPKLPLEAALQTAQLQSPGAEYRIVIATPALRQQPVSPAIVRLVAELLSNSVKFRCISDTAEAEAQEDDPIEICAKAESGMLRISVRDSGIGIRPEEVPAAVEPLTRLNPKDAYAGSGLGLAICQRILDTLGGRLEIAPNQPAGTVASFVVPLAA